VTWGKRLYFPSERRHVEDFFARKNPVALAGSEPAILGTRGQKPLLYSVTKNDIIVFFSVTERVKTAVQWEQAPEDIWKNGIRVIINHFKEVRQVMSRNRH
jgi:hypothetical protein